MLWDREDVSLGPGLEGDDLVLLKQDGEDGQVALLRLLDLGPAFGTHILAADVDVHEGGELGEGFLQLPLLLEEGFTEGVDLAVGDLQLVGLVLLELLDHGLVVQDEFLDLDVLVLFVVDLPMRHC
jgi:hypothetical protein